jgi:type IV secretory pathway TrbD component
MSGPVETPMRSSLNRPQQIAGGDRELVLATLMIGAVVIASGFSWDSFVVGLAFVFASLTALRKMGKLDPLLRKVYSANRKYKDFYPAKSGRLISGRPTPMNWIRNKYV